MLLELSGASFAYPGRTLFDGVNATLTAGRSLALMGPSGVGKSTLLSMAAGYLEPTSGHVSVTLPSANDGLEYVIQAAPLLEHRSALDNACLARLIRKGPHDELLEQARSVLTRLGLTGQISSPVHRLSGGERQRVAIARAVIAEPALLLADEPTAALDGKFRDVVMDVLLDLLDTGCGIVIATHDPDVAARCDEVLVLGTSSQVRS